MNAEISVFVIRVESIIYLLLYNLHDGTFKTSCQTLSKAFEMTKNTHVISTHGL